MEPAQPKAKIERPLIVINVKNKVFQGSLYRGFHQGLNTYFAACQSQATLVEFNGDDLALIADQIRRTAVEKRNDYVIFFKQEGGRVDQGNGGSFANLNYKVMAYPIAQFEQKDPVEYWYGGFEQHFLTDNPFVDGFKTGDLLALQFVQRLESDRVLQPCHFAQKKG